jgi:hypothetical protein
VSKELASGVDVSVGVQGANKGNLDMGKDGPKETADNDRKETDKNEMLDLGNSHG